MHENWMWDPAKVTDSMARDSRQVFFACGSSRNRDEFLDLFDGVFNLHVDDVTLEQRLRDRTNNDFGKDPAELELMLTLNRLGERPHGAIDIDASRSVDEVVDEILRLAGCPMTAQDRREKHSRTVPGGRGFWWTDELWKHAASLTPYEVELSGIPDFDANCWFSDEKPPTVRAVAEHTRRINDADLRYPIILNAAGELMDGGHRVAKAWLEGRTHILAVRFEQDPTPNWVE